MGLLDGNPNSGSASAHCCQAPTSYLPCNPSTGLVFVNHQCMHGLLGDRGHKTDTSTGICSRFSFYRCSVNKSSHRGVSNCDGSLHPEPAWNHGREHAQHWALRSIELSNQCSCNRRLDLGPVPRDLDLSVRVERIPKSPCVEERETGC